jgi:Fic family protein
MGRMTVSQYAVTTAGGRRARSFPRHCPEPLQLDGSVRNALDQGLLALGRLDGAAATLPDVRLLLYTFQRKEAVLSSQIEGTQSTLDDLLAHELGEAPGVPLADVTEVSRYVAAMTHGLQRLRDGFPLSNRLLREMRDSS